MGRYLLKGSRHGGPWSRKGGIDKGQNRESGKYLEGGKKMANNGLMDFVDRGNFDFFKFYTYGDSTHQERDELKKRCHDVVECAHAAKQNMCLVGFNLLNLKNSGTWRDVMHPEYGNAFWHHSFEEFCYQTFRLSDTHTSNLLRLAQFVKLSGDNVDFIDPKYKDYNMSQLVELAAVAPSSRNYFNHNMTVKEMRAAKNYMKMGSFYKDRTESDFDLMKGMQAWEQRKQEAAAQKAAQKTETPKQLPGQMHMEGLTEIFEETPSQNPTSDLAERGGRVESDVIEDVMPVFDPPSSWEAEVENETAETEEISSYTYEEPEEEQDESEEPETPAEQDEAEADFSETLAEQDEAEDSLAETLTSRDKVRNFLNGYKEWFDISSYFLKMYVHYWRNGAAVYAVESIARADMESEPTNIVRYYWRRDEEDRAFEIPKNELWKYIVEKRFEL